MADKRRVTLKGNVSVLSEQDKFGFGIYVREGVPLPVMGDAVEASQEGTNVVYAGKVIAVDAERRTYDVSLGRSIKKARRIE